jgi:hypothetical protein
VTLGYLACWGGGKGPLCSRACFRLGRASSWDFGSEGSKSLRLDRPVCFFKFPSNAKRFLFFAGTRWSHSSRLPPRATAALPEQHSREREKKVQL